MDLRHLRSFLAVADELHSRRAALRVGISQPALSQHIAALEEDVGVALIDRSRRRVELTEAGRVFAERVRRVLGELNEAVEETRRLGRTSHQRLRLGYLEFINLPFLGALVRKLKEEHPEIILERRDMWSGEVVAALVEGALDVGFAFMPITHPTLAFRPVLEGHWVAVLSEGNPLSRSPTIPLQALANEPLILFDRSVNPPLYDWLVGRCEASGFSPRIAYATTQPQVGVDLAAQGVGCFLVGSYVVRRLPEGVTSRPLGGFDTSLRMAAVWRSDDRTPATKSFLDCLRGVTTRPVNGDR